MQSPVASDPERDSHRAQKGDSSEPIHFLLIALAHTNLSFATCREVLHFTYIHSSEQTVG